MKDKWVCGRCGGKFEMQLYEQHVCESVKEPVYVQPRATRSDREMYIEGYGFHNLGTPIPDQPRKATKSLEVPEKLEKGWLEFKDVIVDNAVYRRMVELTDKYNEIIDFLKTDRK